MFHRLSLLAAATAGVLLMLAPSALASPSASSTLPILATSDVYIEGKSHHNKTVSAALYKTLKDWRAAKMLTVVCWSTDDWNTLDVGASTMAFWSARTPRTLNVSPGICELVSEAVDSSRRPNAGRAYALPPPPTPPRVLTEMSTSRRGELAPD